MAVQVCRNSDTVVCVGSQNGGGERHESPRDRKRSLAGLVISSSALEWRKLQDGEGRGKKWRKEKSRRTRARETEGRKEGNSKVESCRRGRFRRRDEEMPFLKGPLSLFLHEIAAPFLLSVSFLPFLLQSRSFSFSPLPLLVVLVVHGKDASKYLPVIEAL